MNEKLIPNLHPYKLLYWRKFSKTICWRFEDSKETIDLQDLLKILRKWLQIEVDRNTYVEFLNIAGLLNHKAGDQLIELQHMR